MTQSSRVDFRRLHPCCHAASKAVEVSRPYRRAELAAFVLQPAPLKTSNRFALLHQIQAITRNRFSTSRLF
jgi:hypothetical protein